MRKSWNYSAPGTLVEVNRHKMHVFSCGSGTETIVFMSGGSTPCPTLDFKPIWSILSNYYKIAVVEKAGYGWSETARVSRDLDIMLGETRASLKKSGLNPPYILAPHSMSGLESIYWAQKYPQEVTSIIGLDPAVPKVYDLLKGNSILLYKFMGLFVRLGFHKPFAGYFCKHTPSVQSGFLSDDDIKLFKKVFRKSFLTPNMLQEITLCKMNANKVASNPLPKDTPMYFFVSDGKEVGVANWREILCDYVSQMRNGNFLFLNCGHYVHAYEPVKIAKEIRAFLNMILN